MTYRVLIKPSAERSVHRLPYDDALRIFRALKNLETEPRPPGCLKLTAEEGYRIRVGRYRILYEVDDTERAVIVYRIRHRGDVYRH